MNIEINKDDDNFIYSGSQKILTQIVSEQDEATYKSILRYCEENNVIPNVISEEKLKIVLRLGIAELNKRDLLLTKNLKEQIFGLKGE